MPEKPPSPAEIEASFRQTLDDLVPVLQKAATYCGTVEDLLGMVRLALKNDGQLRWLMRIVARSEE